jgi:methionine sulfoxide reductase catalytic subunit
MLIRKPHDIPSREITPPDVYLNRRGFVRAAVMAGSVAATAGVYRLLNTPPGAQAPRERLANIVRPTTSPSSQPSAHTAEGAVADGNAAPAAPTYDDNTLRAFRTDEAQTSFEDITHYNNFYEFSTEKDGVAWAARKFAAKPWQIQVDGLCGKPRTFGLEELLALPQEERVYRMRCVEAWSMVIPWVGFPLATILNKVEPRSGAKYVKFETLLDPKRMPNQNRRVLEWPYVEGLRMDEAMHPLTLLATGIYGSAMPPQNGAPIRLVVPWKYGFKGIKSIVRIRLLAEQPISTWTNAGPDEYGFYSNVNPGVDHPRWSQATERRIGEFGRRETLMFNGYAEQVAHLYAGMDLRKYF